MPCRPPTKSACEYGDVKPGDTVFIAGAGPVGMSALLTAQLYSPAAIIVCDMDENRLKLAKELGATHTISPASGDVSKQVADIVGEDGVDCAIERSVSLQLGICAKTL